MMTPGSLGPWRRSKDFAAHWWHTSLIRGVGNTASDFLENKVKKKANANDPDESPLLALMREYNSPITREEFLDLNYMGLVPDEIPPEDEMEFPRQFQSNPDPDDDADWDG
jgi:hypothetical protein